MEYADGSIYYIFATGTTPPGTYSPSYTTPADKVPVALYFYAAASGGFPPYQVDVDEVRVTPAGASQAPLPPSYAFTGEWWEQDYQLLHLRARWYDVQNGIFLSKDAWEGSSLRPQSLNGWSYVEGNPVNSTDPSGMFPDCQSSTSCKVEILSVPVRDYFTVLGHTLIIYTGRKGNINIIEAGPDNGQLIMRKPLEPANPAERVNLNIASKWPYGGRVTVAEGESTCDKWICLKSKFMAIHLN